MKTPDHDPATRIEVFWQGFCAFLALTLIAGGASIVDGLDGRPSNTGDIHTALLVFQAINATYHGVLLSFSAPTE
jgi:Flp pilus assembly pilin Flp